MHADASGKTPCDNTCCPDVAHAHRMYVQMVKTRRQTSNSGRGAGKLALDLEFDVEIDIPEVPRI